MSADKSTLSRLLRTTAVIAILVPAAFLVGCAQEQPAPPPQPVAYQAPPPAPAPEPPPPAPMRGQRG